MPVGRGCCWIWCLLLGSLQWTDGGRSGTLERVSGGVAPLQSTAHVFPWLPRPVSLAGPVPSRLRGPPDPRVCMWSPLVSCLPSVLPSPSPCPLVDAPCAGLPGWICLAVSCQARRLCWGPRFCLSLLVLWFRGVGGGGLLLPCKVLLQSPWAMGAMVLSQAFLLTVLLGPVENVPKMPSAWHQNWLDSGTRVVLGGGISGERREKQP